MYKNIEYSLEVKEAFLKRKPIVALESTIISHGMPYPQNKETAINAENIIRENGCVPATIAIIKGKIKIGLSNNELDYLAKEGRKVMKVSRRDIPYVISKELDGATTVAATMIIANLVNIQVFATGGIGGVHRDAQNTFDISCDLEELAHTNVVVVCAGAKSILDLGKTVEYLETKGVPLIGYKTSILPAFYTSNSPYKVSHQLDTPIEIAEFVKAKWGLGLKGGVIIANPIPKEYEMDEATINRVIDEAIEKANMQNIIGKEITPFLLSEVCLSTNGNSLASNIKLVYNNCKLAAEIAKELE